MSVKKVLFTFPGKLGDLIYTFPVIKSFKDRYPKYDIHYVTSSFCEAAIPLMQEQPFIDYAFIDWGYVPLNFSCGVQPSEMSEHKGYDFIFHLGFSPEHIGPPTNYKSIIAANYATMWRRYQINLTSNEYESDDPYVFIRDSVKPKEKYIVLHAYAESIQGSYSISMEQKIEIFESISDMLEILGLPAIAICGPDDKAYHKQFGVEVLTPENLLEAAFIIKNSTVFLGVQSCPYVIADGLKHPRIIYGAFSHVMPTKGGYYSIFNSTSDFKSIANQAKKSLGF